MNNSKNRSYNTPGKQLFHNALILIAATLAILATSCSGGNKFKVEGTVDGNVTMNLRIVYQGDNNINNVLTASRDGKFTFEGQAPGKGKNGGALVEILDNDYRPLAALYACAGDKVKVSFKVNEPWTATLSGNNVNEQWSQWLKQNTPAIRSRDAVAVNKAVEEFVTKNPDNVLSSILMATQYNASLNPAQAAKLLETIRPEARPAWIVDSRLLTHPRLQNKYKNGHIPPLSYISAKTDSIATFNPARYKRTLIAFTNERSGRGDSIIDKLKETQQRIHADYAILDIYLDSDTSSWRRELRADSITWLAGWTVGGPAGRGISKLNIPTIPFFLVVNTQGTPLYQGTSISQATAALTQ